jgi:fumarate hydratase class I
MTFQFQELFPLVGDTVPYRTLTTQGVSIATFGKDEIVKVESEAIRALSEQAFVDINHLLRPGHLAQLAKILDDPEATSNDKFVAYDLLKNANIAAGGVLPMCQDTGTAIVMGKKGRRAALDVRGEEYAVEPPGPDRDLCGGRGRLQIPLRRQGRRQRQQELPLSGDAVHPDP